jgi:HAD superfamily hydrolase (TIGR01549 family)
MIDLPRVRALVFDVDGTIADTDDHLVAQVGAVLGRVPGLSGRRAGRLARQIVMAAETPTNALYGLLDKTGLDASLRGLRGLSARLRAQRRRPTSRPEAAVDEHPHDMVPDVAEMLKALAGRYPMATMSTGQVPRIEAFLAHHGVRDLFAAVVGAETTPRMKPFADPLLFAAEAMGVPAEACLVVGDTTVDMLTARAGGAQAVGVLCGFGTRAELERTGAALILNTTSDLLRVLAPADDALGKTAAPPGAPPSAPAPGRAA